MKYVKYTTSVFIAMHFPSFRNDVLTQELSHEKDKNQEPHITFKFSEVL